MKKFFTLIAAVAMAASVNAQKLTFDAYVAQTVPAAYSADGLVLTVNNAGNKFAVDSNSQFFGTADSYVQFKSRLKSGGKSAANNGLTLTLPSDGTVKVYVRSSSSSASRTVTFSQNGTDLLKQEVTDSKAIKTTIEEEEKSVFPVYSFDAKKGDVTITYDGGANFYSFEFISGGATGIKNVTSETSVKSDAIYNLAGQQVSKDYKGVVIQNGKKFLNK